MSIQDSVTTQLMAAVRTPETTLFFIFFYINSELKENKKNKYKNKNFKGNDAPESKQNKETLSNPNP